MAPDHGHSVPSAGHTGLTWRSAIRKQQKTTAAKATVVFMQLR
jgi:hypothetical protein